MVFLWIFAVLTVLTLLISAVFYFAAFYNPNRKDMTRVVLTGRDYDPFHDEMARLIDEAVKIPEKDVYTVSCDRKRLYGRLYLQKAGAPFHIQFNGYKGNGLRDFSGGLRLALEQGENVLLVDQRSHGKSAGHTITFGVKERKDVLSWIAFLQKEFGDVPIYLEGVSMGAATVLMASDLDLPHSVRGIVADCPYSSPFEIVNKVAEEILKIRGISYPFIFLGALLFGRFNIFSSSAVKSVKNAKAPILLIHGSGDRYVPVEMSRRIKEQNQNKITYLEVEGAPHGLSMLRDPAAYRAAYLDFMKKTRA